MRLPSRDLCQAAFIADVDAHWQPENSCWHALAAAAALSVAAATQAQSAACSAVL